MVNEDSDLFLVIGGTVRLFALSSVCGFALASLLALLICNVNWKIWLEPCLVWPITRFYLKKWNTNDGSIKSIMTTNCSAYFELRCLISVAQLPLVFFNWPKQWVDLIRSGWESGFISIGNKCFNAVEKLQDDWKLLKDFILAPTKRENIDQVGRFWSILIFWKTPATSAYLSKSSFCIWSPQRVTCFCAVFSTNFGF